jgi:uncharacterized protein (DUF58 family)
MWRRSKGVARVDNDEVLFDDDFQRKLEYLALVSRRVFSGRLRAQRRTRKTGSGIEFADHREYQPGDDLRYLDWNVYQRFGRLLVRLFEEEEDLSVYVVVDASASMAFGQGRKFRHARRLAAALAYVGLANLDRVTVVTTADDVVDHLPETRGKGRIFRVFRYLEAAKAGGATDLYSAMRTFVARHKRRGLVVLLTDLFDPKGFEAGLNVLRYNKFEAYVVHLVDAADRAPSLAGDVLVYDCETGDEREVTVTADVLEKYERAYDAFVHSAERFCACRQVPYLSANVSVPVDELVLRILRRGGFVK